MCVSHAHMEKLFNPKKERTRSAEKEPEVENIILFSKILYN